MAAAAFAQPGEALAHGIAHQREHHHEHRDAHDESGHAATIEHPEPSGWSSPGHTHGHVHADVDDASIRNRVDAAAIAPEVVLPESTIRELAVETQSLRPPLARGDPATGPPPRLRAPPVR